MGQNHFNNEKIRQAFFLNLSFMLIEVIGGLITGSLAILSDALHDLGDSITLGAAWYLERISRKGRTATFSYGYKRFSLLGGLISGIVLLIGSVVVLFYAIPGLIDPKPVHAEGMLIFAVLGVIINGYAALSIRKGKSLNEKMIGLHLLEDVLGWVAVLVGSLFMVFFEIPWLDPLLSVFISLFILFHVFVNLKKNLRLLLQGTPPSIDIGKMHQTLTHFSEIRGIHDCHVWSMDGNYHVLTIHLVLCDNYDLKALADLKKRVRASLADSGVDHVTLEFELPDEPCGLINC